MIPTFAKQTHGKKLFYLMSFLKSTTILLSTTCIHSFKLFCRKSISQSSGETKYKCTKSIVDEKLQALKKSLKTRSKRENFMAFYKRVSPLFVICCVSVTLMCTLTFLEAACAIFIMSIPAYAVCCASRYRSYPGRGWPPYFGVIRLCSYTFTLYGFVWVIFGDLFAVKNFETVSDVGL